MIIVSPPEEGRPLLRIRGLSKHFTRGRSLLSRGDTLCAVDGVDLEIGRGKTVALVGESGCGKTTTGRLIVGLISPTAGTIELDGQDIVAIKGSARHQITRRIQMVFQDPAGSLNPRLRIEDSIAEPLRSHRWGTASAIREEVAKLLERVGLDASVSRRFPHEFSGGQRQRIGIARAIALQPDLIVADEPTSALDVSIRVQILRLLSEIQRDTGTSFLFISHDLAVVRHYSQSIAVMYAGRIVEEGPTEVLLEHPRHPYTRQILESVPSLDPLRKRVLIESHGLAPSAASVIPQIGCSFAPRCPLAIAHCRQVAPHLLPVIDAPTCFIACHRVDTSPAPKVVPSSEDEASN